MAAGIDKAKLLDQAQKYVQKGQIEKAISEYQKVVEADPKDLRTRLKLGELHLKVGNKTPAVNEYSAVAGFYTSDGFNLQAIAVFKQLLKIDPSISDAYVKLAELYKKQGLIADAIAQYRIVITNYEKQGKTREALGALKQMASLDPENFSIRAKLADLLMKSGNKKEGLEEFSRIADDLKKKGRVDDVVMLYERLLSADPSSTDAVRGLADAYLKTGRTKQALNSLQTAIKLDPKDTRNLTLLAETYLQSNDEKKAKQTYLDILRMDPSSDEGRKGLVKLLIKEGNPQEGIETALPFIDKALKVGNYDAALGLLLDFYRNDIKEPIVLEKMAETYKLKGESDRETAVRNEIAQLKGEAPIKVNAVEEIEPEALEVEEVHIEEPPKEETAIELEPEELEIEPLHLEEPPMEEHFILPEEKLGESPVSEDVQKYLTEAEVYVKYGLVDKAVEVLKSALNLFPDNVEVRNKIASLGAPPEEIKEVEEVSMEIEVPEEISLPEIEEIPELEIEEEVHIESPVEEVSQAKEEYPLSKIKEGLEETDFYIQQGLYDDARSICSRILEYQPGNKEALSKLQAIDDAAQAALLPPETPTSHPAEESFFDLAAELDAEEAETISTPAGMREAEKFGFEDIFSEFKKGVDSQLEKEDAETHYNLGIAYKEMGLLDDAVREFKIASADPKKEFDCCNLIGICYKEKDEPQKAVEVFKKCLGLKGRSQEEYASISYELGMAYELSGLAAEALAAYMEAGKKSPGFRDVDSKITKLSGSRDVKKGRVSYV